MDVRVGPLRKLSTEKWRINAFELWYWRRLLRVPWTARWSSYSILKKSVLNIHWKGWCWSWSSNSLAIWCEELTHGKDTDAGKDRKQEEKGMTEDEMVGWHHWLNGHKSEQASGVGDGQGSLVVLQSIGLQSWTWLSDWTELMLWLNFHAIHHYCKKNWGQVSWQWEFNILIFYLSLLFIL